MQKQLMAIGEALIDFIPNETGVSLTEVEAFIPKVGGAPANVCGAFAKLGGRATMLTKLGKDAFGNRIIADLERHHIDVSHILRTDEANTALAFVSLAADGNREFSFYRKPSADMLLAPEEVENVWFKDVFALHFCSVDLIPSPMKAAHEKAIALATEQGGIISFDPNIRLPLWESEDALRQTILDFIPKAHIVKISDEELAFITGCLTIEEAREKLFVGNVQLVIYTKGSEGAEAYTKETQVSVASKRVQAVDTTGAGDGFIGAFLYKLYQDHRDVNSLKTLGAATLEDYLTFANAFCGYSVLKQGAIDAYPTLQQTIDYMMK